jgi:hypothetical protein
MSWNYSELSKERYVSAILYTLINNWISGWFLGRIDLKIIKPLNISHSLNFLEQTHRTSYQILPSSLLLPAPF